MPLADVNALSDAGNIEWLQRLHGLNIRHVEQLGTLLAAPEGRYALAKRGVPIEVAQKAIEPALTGKLKLSIERPFGTDRSRVALLSREKHPMGFSAQGDDVFRDARLDAPLPQPMRPGSRRKSVVGQKLSPRHNIGDYFTARDQGQRGTCVAFCVSAMYQLQKQLEEADPVQLSPQYLYYRTKLEDEGGLDEDGTSIEAALQTLKSHGCCLDHELEYRGRHDLVQSYTIRGHNPAKAEQELTTTARLHRISGYSSFSPDVDTVKQFLARNIPVGVGVTVFQLAWYNAQSTYRGEIALPMMDTSTVRPTLLDTYLGGHAITLVGYRDNETEKDPKSHRPGGGYFVFRNSWGEAWASKNEAQSGYGFLPYEYLTRFCIEAAVIEPRSPKQPVKRKSSSSQLVNRRKRQI